MGTSNYSDEFKRDAVQQAWAGATMDEIISATGWQAHTARGAMSGVLGKKLGLIVTSAKEDSRARGAYFVETARGCGRRPIVGVQKPARRTPK